MKDWLTNHHPRYNELTNEISSRSMFSLRYASDFSGYFIVDPYIQFLVPRCTDNRTKSRMKALSRSLQLGGRKIQSRLNRMVFFQFNYVCLEMGLELFYLPASKDQIGI